MKPATQTLFLHRQAPEKPALGKPCNGCGICCAAEPCPAGRIIFRQRHGQCPALRWAEERYVCGLVTHPGQHLRWLPTRSQELARRLLTRWIAVGHGCDSTAEFV